MNYSKFADDKYFIIKTLALVFLSFAIPFISNIWAVCGIIAAIALVYLISNQKLKTLIADIRIIVYIFIFSSIIRIFVNYIEFKELCMISLRMSALLLLFSIFIRTTHINNLIKFLRKYCNQRIAFALCVSLKFLPLLGCEIKDIYYLQRNRGVKLKFRNFINGSFFLSVIAPFIVVSLKIIGNLILTAHIKKLDLNKQRTNIYKSEKLKKIYVKRCL